MYIFNLKFNLQVSLYADFFTRLETNQFIYP